MRCPCGSGLSYDECCEPLHAGIARAPTAERLMRSRFSAFAVGAEGYLLETWHPSTRPSSLTLDTDLTWYRLDVLARERGGILDTTGSVEFEAFYRSPGGPGSQRELSMFAREEGIWFYVTGQL